MNTNNFWSVFRSLKHFSSLSPRERIERVSFLLDESIPLPMFRIGIDPFLSIIPIFGSSVGLLLSLYFFWEARNLKVPWHVYLRMAGNLMFDFLLGAIPVAGIVADALFKANVRNRRILLRYLKDAPNSNPTRPGHYFLETNR